MNRRAMQIRHPALLLLSLTLLVPRVPAETLAVRTVGSAEGLSQSSVNAILRDRTGYMWFATQDGLNRYDGYSVSVYRHNPADSTSLADNFVWRLFPARDGGFWIGTFKGGLNHYDPERNAFTRYRHDPGDSASLSEDNVTAIHQDADGTLWVGTWFGGLNRRDPARQGFHHEWATRENPAGLSDNRISAIVRDSSGRLWVGTWRGLNLLDETTGRWRRFLHDPHDPGTIGADAIWGMTVDAEGRLWIATWGGGLSVCDPSTLRFTTYRHNPADPGTLGGNLLRAVHADADGTIWVGTYGAGLSRLDPRSGRCENFVHDPLDPAGLPSNEIQSICRDSSGMLWIGTAAGVASHHSYRAKFHVFRHTPLRPASLSHSHITAVHVDADGGLWVGTHGKGLNYRAPGASVFSVIRHDPADASSLSSDLVTAILRQRDGTLWVGTRGAGLNRRRANARAFTRILHDPSRPGTISGNDILALLETDSGELWVGTNGSGLNRYDQERDSWVRYTHRPSDTTSVSGHHIWALAEDSSGTVWVGTWGQGLNRFDRSSQTFRRYPASDAGALTTILSIAPDRAGRLWVGTSDGLFWLDRARETVSAAAAGRGFPSHVIYSILPATDGALWLGTGRGLVRFAPADANIRTYGVHDGLPGTEFMHGAGAIGPDGWMYLGGIDGLTAFHPDSLADNTAPPPVVITRVTVADREIPLSGTAPPQLTLSHDEDFFTIEFAALDYVAPEENRYAFKMEGADEEWVSTGTRRHVSYSHLGSGTYLFRVRGSNSDGVWNTTGTSLLVTITPPFWETAWFRAGAATALIALLALLYRYRIAKLLELERMRIRIASDLHDEVGSSLTKIALYSDLMKDRDTAGADLLPKIGALSRETVSTMSDIVWSIDARNDTVGDLLDRMRDMGHGLLETRQIEFDFRTEGLDPSRKLPVDLRENLYLIFKEALTNAAKYSGATRVRAALVQSARTLMLRVEDNGRGFRTPARSQGQGLRNMEMRAARIGARLTIASDDGVRITLERRPL